MLCLAGRGHDPGGIVASYNEILEGADMGDSKFDLFIVMSAGGIE